MTDYEVTFAIQINAASPLEAAQIVCEFLCRNDEPLILQVKDNKTEISQTINLIEYYKDKYEEFDDDHYYEDDE